VIRNTKSGFREASRRWSGADAADAAAISTPTKPATTVDWFKAAVGLVRDTLLGALMIGFLVVYGLALPFIKLGLFHYISWKAFRDDGWAVGAVVFLMSCAVIDVGLIWGLVRVLTGEMRLY